MTLWVNTIDLLKAWCTLESALGISRLLRFRQGFSWLESFSLRQILDSFQVGHACLQSVDIQHVVLFFLLLKFQFQHQPLYLTSCLFKTLTGSVEHKLLLQDGNLVDFVNVFQDRVALLGGCLPHYLNHVPDFI